MYVSELIDILNQFSFSNTPTDKQRKVYLRCLNLANWDMYQRVINSNIFLNEKSLFIEDDNSFIITDDIYYLKKIYNQNSLVVPWNNKESHVTNEWNYFQLKDNAYFRLGNKLTLGSKSFAEKANDDGDIKKYIDILYIKYPDKLVENVEEDNEIDIPIYPEPFNLALIQGALYYVLLSTKGYHEKTNLQLSRYIESLKNFESYYNKNGSL